MTTMPNFKEWGERTSRGNVEEALKQAYDQGYALGYRDAVEVHTQEEWYEAIDGDVAEYTRWQDNEVLEGCKEGVIQKKDVASGCYVARYVATGIEIGRRCGGQPFANIQIED
jgi:hypothetical protein